MVCQSGQAYECGFVQGFVEAAGARRTHARLCTPPMPYPASDGDQEASGWIDGYIEGWVALLTMAEAVRTTDKPSILLLD